MNIQDRITNVISELQTQVTRDPSQWDYYSVMAGTLFELRDNPFLPKSESSQGQYGVIVDHVLKSALDEEEKFGLVAFVQKSFESE